MARCGCFDQMVNRLRDPVEQALQSVTGEDEVVLLTSLLRELQEPVPDRVGDVLRHENDSMYGFITLDTRQTSAARRRSSIERPLLPR